MLDEVVKKKVWKGQSEGGWGKRWGVGLGNACYKPNWPLLLL